MKNSRARWITRSAVIVVAALALTGCAGQSGGSASGGGDGDPIVIGALQSTTGGSAVAGLRMQAASQVAVDEVNAAGGINGRPVKVIFYDPSGDTAKGVSQTQRLISQDGVDLIVGGGTASGIALAMRPVIQKEGMFFMSTESAEEIVSPVEDAETTFATSLSTRIIVEKLLTELQSEGIDKAGFISDSSGFGISGETAAKAVADDLGMTLLTEVYDPAATDLKPQLNSLKNGGAEAYINWTATPSGVVFLRDASSLGLKNLRLSHTYGDAALISQAGDAAIGARVAGVKATILDDLPADDPEGILLHALQDKLGGEEVTIQHSQAYDAMRITLEAIKQAGSTDGAAVAKALESLEIAGTQGIYRFSDTDHRGLGIDNVIMLEWNGTKFVEVD